MAEIKMNESQSQEISNYYREFSKKYNLDLNKLVYDEDGFMNSCYPDGFPDFDGDVIYSEKYWSEFEKWLKDVKGIELDEGKNKSCRRASKRLTEDGKTEKIRLIWDDCTPTKERRPTTESDIWDDIHIEDFNSKDEFVAFIIGYFLDGDNDLEEYGEDPFEAALNFIESSNDDPGDGSPNFLYISLNGEELDEFTLSYDSLLDLDLEHISENNLKQAMIEYEFGDDDEEEWDEEEYDDEEDFDESLNEEYVEHDDEYYYDALEEAEKNGTLEQLVFDLKYQDQLYFVFNYLEDHHMLPYKLHYPELTFNAWFRSFHGEWDYVEDTIEYDYDFYCELEDLTDYLKATYGSATITGKQLKEFDADDFEKFLLDKYEEAASEEAERNYEPEPDVDPDDYRYRDESLNDTSKGISIQEALNMLSKTE